LLAWGNAMFPKAYIFSEQPLHVDQNTIDFVFCFHEATEKIDDGELPIDYAYAFNISQFYSGKKYPNLTVITGTKKLDIFKFILVDPSALILYVRNQADYELMANINSIIFPLDELLKSIDHAESRLHCLINHVIPQTLSVKSRITQRDLRMFDRISSINLGTGVYVRKLIKQRYISSLA